MKRLAVYFSEDFETLNESERTTALESTIQTLQRLELLCCADASFRSARAKFMLRTLANQIIQADLKFDKYATELSHSFIPWTLRELTWMVMLGDAEAVYCDSLDSFASQFALESANRAELFFVNEPEIYGPGGKIALTTFKKLVKGKRAKLVTENLQRGSRH